MLFPMCFSILEIDFLYSLSNIIFPGREGQMPLREGGGGGRVLDIGTVSIKEEDKVGSSSEAGKRKKD